MKHMKGFSLFLVINADSFFSKNIIVSLRKMTLSTQQPCQVEVEVRSFARPNKNRKF